jgi:hypothetical protein
VLLSDPAYPVAALFFTLNGAPLGPEAVQLLAPPCHLGIPPFSFFFFFSASRWHRLPY